MKIVKFKLLFIITFLLALTSCSQDSNNTVDELTQDLLKSETFREFLAVPMEASFIRANYYEQGMKKIENTSKVFENLNLDDNDASLKKFNEVYGEKFGQRMLTLERKEMNATLNFMQEYKKKYEKYSKEEYMQAFRKANKILTKENFSRILRNSTKD